MGFLNWDLTGKCYGGQPVMGKQLSRKRYLTESGTGTMHHYDLVVQDTGVVRALPLRKVTHIIEAKLRGVQNDNNARVEIEDNGGA
jgi:hypothetical protein